MRYYIVEATILSSGRRMYLANRPRIVWTADKTKAQRFLAPAEADTEGRSARPSLKAKRAAIRAVPIEVTA